MTLKQKGEINTDTIIVGDFNTLLSTMERSSKRRINQETADLNNTTDHMDRIDTHTEHSICQQYNIHSSQTHVEAFLG